MKLRNTWAFVCAMVLIIAGNIQAANLTWDANNTGALQTDGVGTWLNANQWWNGSTNVTWNNTTPDNATIGNGGAGNTITLGTVNAGTVTFGSFTGTYTLSGGILNQSGGISVATNSVSISSVLSGSGGITKAGAGTLTLSGNPNQFTGNTVISNGKVALGAQYALWQSAYDTTGSTGAIGLDRGTQTAPVLGGLAGSVDLATAITGYSGITSLTLNPQSSYTNTYSGVIANGSGAMTLTKTGDGAQALTGVNSYSGATTIYDGTLGLGGAAGSALNSAFTVRGGTLSLDNSAGWTNRLADGTALSLGSLTLNSDNGGSPQTETVGATTFATSGKITINNGTGAGTTLALGAVTRSAGAAIDFGGTGLGTLGGGASSPNVTSTSWPALGNGILAWATVNGTNWAATGANGIVAYSGTFVDPTSAASDSTTNAQLTGTGSIGTAKAFNSLNTIASGAGQSLSLGANLNLTSGGLLKSGTDSYTISGSGTLGAGAAGAGTELIAHVDGGDLTVSAPLNTAIVGLAKGGTGKLVLSGTRAGTFSNPISIAGGQLEFQGATTLLNGTVSGPGGLTVNLNAGQRLRLNAYGANGNTYSGPTVVKGGILEIGSGYDMTGNFPGVLPSTSIASAGQGLLSNLELNGGILAVRYYMSEFLGSGPGQFQITGGRSGISTYQTDMGQPTWTINSDANYEVVWGALGEGGATGYFNPSVFLLGDSSHNGGNVQGINNKIDLNGATRTVASDVSTTTGGGRLGGVIRNSSGTAGLVKTGVGPFELAGLNTFNGSVSIEQGLLSINSIANGGVASALGMSSAAAANLLLANGTTLKYTGGAATSDRSFTINGTAAGDSATLDASGTGALVLNSTATPGYGTSGQTRTLILGGSSTYTNTLAATLTDNGGAAVSVAKIGAGTWVLSGANTYTGTNILTAGKLIISATNNLGSGGLLVFNGGTLSITNTTLTSLSSMGHPIICNPGVSVNLEIASTGNTFTVDQAIAGSVNVVKSGPGTLVFSTNNTYSGSTTINGGVLQYNDGSIIPTTPLINNSALVVNRTGTDTQGSTFHSIMVGTGTVTMANSGTLALNNINLYSGATKANAGTIALSHPLALRNSAIDTTGSGVFTFSGAGTNGPTIGGLTQSGTPRDLASVFTTGYSSVTNLTLNPSGTVTYGGVIADNAGMMLTMAGTGTQVLTNSNTYAGATILKAGTLELSGLGSILNSAVTFAGGGLKLSNTSAETGSGRVHDTTGITANGGTLTYNNTSGTPNYAETVGSVALTSGQLDIVEAVNQAGAGSQTLTLAGLTQSDAAAVTFSALTTAPNATKNMIKVSGASGAGAGQNLPGGVIVGPWATAGTAANAQTDYAVYDASGYILPANITASAENTWTAATNAYTLTIPAKAAAALTATRNITALKESSTKTSATAASGTFTVGSAHSLAVGDPVVLDWGGNITGLNVGTVYYVQSVPSSTTFTLAATPGGTALNVSGTVNFTGGLKLDSGINLGTYGILNSGAAPFGIGRTTAGGNITLPTAGASKLYVTLGSGSGNIVIDAPIVDNGGALTLVKSGSGVLRLSGTNTYTGGTVINGGVVMFTSSSNFGAAGSTITFNGSGALSFGPNNAWAFASGGTPDLGTHPVVLNNGAVAGLYYNSPNTTMIMSGAITGNGGIIVDYDPWVNLGGGHGADSFISLSSGNTFTGPITLMGGNSGGMSYAFNSLSDSTSPITFNAAGGGGFSCGSTATANMSIPNRPIDLRNSNTTIANANATYTLTLGPVSTTTAGAKTLSLGAGGAGGYIAGAITDGLGQIAVTQSGSPWYLAGTNTYTGMTTAYTLTLQGKQAVSPYTKFSLPESGNLRFLDDGVGTISLDNNVRNTSSQTGAQTAYTIFVGNNGTSNGGSNPGSTTTGSTIALGTLLLGTDGNYDNRTYYTTVNVTGANGYRLQVANIDLPVVINNTHVNEGMTLYPTTAAMTITGKVQNVIGATAGSTASNFKLNLSGTAKGNLISGSIKDAADYPSNANAKPLNVIKNDTGDWTLSNTNTYSGTTTMKAGKFIVTGSISTGAVSVTAGALGGTGTVGGAVTVSGTGGIDLRDGAVGTLTLCNGLAITGGSGANNLYFDLGTAANGVDKIVVTGNVTMATSGAGVITLNQLPGTKINADTYDLIVATGTMEPASKFTLATTAVAGNTFSLQVTGSTLQLVVVAGNDGPATTVWTGGVNTNWNNIGNWTSGTVPGIQSDAAFYNTGAGNLSTTLDADFDINSLNFNSGAVSSVTVGGIKMLTLEATNGVGLTASTPSSGTPTHTISTRVGMGSSQAWIVNTNAAVTVSGVVSDFGAGRSLTKAGAGTLTLNGLNTYSGPTIVSNGTLAVSHVSLTSVTTSPNALGMSSAAPANLLLNPGSTLKFLITADNYMYTDRGFTINGTANGDSVTLDSSYLSGNAYRGVNLSSTASPVYGTADQTRTLNLSGTHTQCGNMTYPNALAANIPDNGSGAVSLIKNGIGYWQLNGVNTFSGGVTVNAGLLILGNASALGTGPLTINGGGLESSVASLVNSRNNTQNWNGDFSFSSLTGGQSLNLGIGAVTLGGTRTVTVNANTLTVGGVIAGASGYGLTKAGAGTLALTTNNTYNGATTVTAGTLQLSGASGTILNSAVTTTGGALTLLNANGANNGNRVSDSAAFTMIGGTLNFNNDATANDFSESVGTLTLAGGANTVAIGQAASGRTSTLTFAGLSRTMGAINFSGTGLGTTVDTRSRITFTTPPALVNGIIGPWATVNGTAYATLDGTNNVVAYSTYTDVNRGTGGTKAIPDSLGTDVRITESGAAVNITLAGVTTTTIRSLLNSTSGGIAAAATIDIASGKTLLVDSINTVPTLPALTLGTAANTGTLKPATSGGNLLLVNSSANTMTINSVIADNTSASSVTKDGSGTLTLSATTSTYTGGTVINAGTVTISADTNLGNSSGGITFNGSASLNHTATFSMARSITINNGAVVTFPSTANNGSTLTISGPVTGNGGVFVTAFGDLTLSSAANTFTGPIWIGFTSVGNIGGTGMRLKVSSLGDSASPITFGYANTAPGQGHDHAFIWAGSSDLVLTNRYFQFGPVANPSTYGSGMIENANAGSGNTLTIKTDLSVLTVGGFTKYLTLRGVNTGNNTFAGKIGDGIGMSISLIKDNAGLWILSNTNTYSGATTISGGILSINSIANVNGGASALGLPTTAANGTITISGGATLQYTGSGHTSDRVIGMTGATTLDASGTGAWVLTSPLTGAQALTLTGNSAAANTIGGALPGTTLTKSGIGTWMLSGANTLTSTTTLSGGGALILDYTTQNNSKLADGAALTLSGGTLTLKDGSHTEVVSATSLNAGGTFLTRDGGTTSKLRMNAITRAAGGTISFADATIADTDTANAAGTGILGGWATLGSDWATSAASGTDIAISALSSYTGTLPSTLSAVTTANYTLTGPQTQTAAVSANTVKIANSGNSQTLTLGANNLTITALGGLLYVGGNDSNYTISGTGIVGTPAGELIITTVSGTTLNMSAPIIGSGAGILTKTGVGTLVLNAASLYTGATYVNQGTLRLANATAAGTVAGTIYVQNGAALELVGGITIGAKPITTVGTGVSSQGALSNYSGTNTYTGAITVGTGGALIKSVSGLLTLGGAIATSLGNDLIFDGTGDVTVTNVISGAGRVIKNGTGTLTLTTNNTYSGATLINEGTLVGVVGGSCSNSAVTVASAGALGVSVTDNSKKWTCASLALNNGSQLKFNFTGTPSTTVAPLNILGSLTFSGTPTIVVSPSNTAPGTYPLLTVGGSAPTSVPTLTGVSYGKLAWIGNTLWLTIVPAPTVITFF